MILRPFWGRGFVDLLHFAEEALGDSGHIFPLWPSRQKKKRSTARNLWAQLHPNSMTLLFSSDSLFEGWAFQTCSFLPQPLMILRFPVQVKAVFYTIISCSLHHASIKVPADWETQYDATWATKLAPSIWTPFDFFNNCSHQTLLSFHICWNAWTYPAINIYQHLYKMHRWVSYGETPLSWRNIDRQRLAEASDAAHRLQDLLGLRHWSEHMSVQNGCDVTSPNPFN